MYKLKINFIILFLFLSFGNVYANTITLNFGNLKFIPNRGFVKIQLKGFHYFSGKGEPMFPYKDTLIFIGDNNVKIDYEPVDSVVFSDISIAPAQRAFPTDNNDAHKFRIDSTIYNNDKPIPERIVKFCGFGYKRGVKYNKLLISPFKYFPKEKKLTYYNNIRLSVPNTPSRANKNEMFPGIVVITDSSFVGQFDRYLKMKSIEGFTPNIRSVQYVYENYSGVDNAEKIRNYLKTLVDSGIEYVVIGGDVNIVPTRYAYAMESGGGWWYDSIPTDYYYGDIDGSWNANNNTVYGEVGDSVDMLPDFYVGRISFENSSELDTILGKIFYYEKGDYLKPQCSVLANAGFLDSYTDASVGLDSILEEFPDYFAKSRLYDGNGNQVYLNEFMDSLNSGFNYLIHSNHGNSYGFSIGQDFFGYDNADTLSNLQNSPTLVYTTSCISASFDTDCMAEHFLRALNGGGFYIGDARYGWYIGYYSGESSTDRMQKLFFKNLFDEKSHTIGELVSKNRETFAPSASMENTYRWMEYNLVLMGDPSTYLRTDSLKNLHVNYSTLENGNISLHFEVSDGKAPVSSAVISLFKGDSMIERGITGISGEEEFTIPDVNGVINYFVYKNNYRLFEDSIVNSNELKYVKAFVRDGNDSLFNPDETDTLNMIISNGTDSTIYNPLFICNSYDGFVIVSDTSDFLDSIISGETDTLSYIVTINDNADSISTFYLKLNGNYVADSILFKICKGELEIDRSEISIDGFPSAFPLEIKNTGTGYIEEGILYINSLDSDINVTPVSISVSNLYPGDSTEVSLNVDTLNAVPLNSIHKILVGDDTLTLLYSWKIFSEMVDSLNPYGWEMSGIAHVSSKRYYSTPYSFRFGVGEDSLGYYANDSLISPWIKSTGKMILKYKTWFDLQAGWDFGLIFVGKDNDWSLVDSYSGISNNWITMSNELNKYAAGDSFRLKFVASTYNDTGYEGWYIDNIEILPDDGISGIKIITRKNIEHTFRLINSVSSGAVECIVPDNFDLNKLNIMDISGRKVYPQVKKISENRLKININKLGTGLYFIKYGKSAKKIIKI